MKLSMCVRTTWISKCFYWNSHSQPGLKSPFLMSCHCSMWQSLLGDLLCPWWGLAVLCWNLASLEIFQDLSWLWPWSRGCGKYVFLFCWISINYTLLVSHSHLTPSLVLWTSLKYGCVFYFALGFHWTTLKPSGTRLFQWPHSDSLFKQ